MQRAVRLARCQHAQEHERAMPALADARQVAGCMRPTGDVGAPDRIHVRLCLRAQVDRSNVRAPPEEEEVYRGVAAPTRKAVTEEATIGDMPKAR